MRRRWILLVLVAAACGGGGEAAAPSTAAPEATTTEEVTTTTVEATTTTATAAEPFRVSGSDYVQAFNLSMGLAGSQGQLPETIVGGVIVGAVGDSGQVDVLVQVDGDLTFDPVAFVVVRVDRVGSSVTTPARILGIAGGALAPLDADAIAAFNQDVVPRLGELSDVPEAIAVGDFYDFTGFLTPGSVSWVFTPRGVEATMEQATLGL